MMNQASVEYVKVKCEKKKRTSSVKVRKVLDKIATYIILIFVCFVFVFPCIWLIATAFSKSGNMFSSKYFFPSEFSFNVWMDLFGDTKMYDFPNWFKNSLLVAVSSAVISTILVIATAYTISFFQFKMRKPLMKITLVLGMFPSFMGMTAVYIMMTQFKMVDTLWGLVLIYSAGAPMGYLVQKGFFDTIPYSIYEAARIDGSSNFRIFRTIILPLSKPMIVYTGLTSFAWPWSDFILPALLLKDKSNWTVAVGLYSLPDTEFARFCAGAVFIAVPIVCLYFLLQKNLVSGLTSGALKE